MSTVEGTARPVDVSVVRPLRGEVLRAGRPPEASVLPGDDHPLARHVAVSVGGQVVSVGSVLPEPPPWDLGRQAAWRIRGMATRDGHRGRGLGHEVLTDLIDHARARGGAVIWCSARTPARGFYARSGFVPVGEAFVTEGVDHVHMWRDLGAD